MSCGQQKQAAGRAHFSQLLTFVGLLALRLCATYDAKITPLLYISLNISTLLLALNRYSMKCTGGV